MNHRIDTILGCKLFISLSICLISSIHSVQAKKQINWQVFHWPPIMILEGENKGKGRYDLLASFIQRQMPQYDHKYKLMNWARLWTEIKRGSHICSFLSFKNKEREKIAHFSIPTSVVFPNHIIMKKTNIELLGNPSSYSLVKLMKDKRFKGALEKFRSYSPPVDKILEKHEKNSNIHRNSQRSKSLVGMLLYDRFTYLLEFPDVATFLERKFRGKSGVLGSMMIQEIDPYTLVHLACPKNEWGKQVIKDLDEVIRKFRSTKEYRDMMGKWHYDKKRLKKIEAEYNNFLRAESK